MTDHLPRYMDGQTSHQRFVRLSVTDQSLLLIYEGQTIALWPFEKIIVKEDWNNEVGGVFSLKDNRDASLAIYTYEDYQRIISQLPKGQRTSFIVPSQYRYLLIMAIGAVAAIILLVPILRYMGAGITHLIPQSIEKKLGNLVLSELEEEFGACVDINAQQATEKIIAHLMIAYNKDQKSQTTAPDVHLLRSSMANAFSIPGYKIVVLDEFLKQAKNENEVAGVLAHEIGHMVNRDALEMFVQSQGMNLILSMIATSGAYGGVAEFATFLQSMNYSRQKEFEADAFASNLLMKAGYSPSGLSAFLGRLDSEETGALYKAMDHLEFLSTHPDTQERIRRIHQTSSETKYRATLSEEEFRSFLVACDAASHESRNQ